jgi:uncharacterized protein (TIGR03437 family)
MLSWPHVSSISPKGVAFVRLALAAVAFVVAAYASPVIDTYSSPVPNSVVAGSGAFTLTVKGTGFVQGSVVQFNATALTTNFVSANSLSAQVPASLIATPGSASITVLNPDGSVSNAASLYVAPSKIMLSCAPATGPVSVHVSYSATCTASGGSAPYSWSIVSGTLPAGLSLSGMSGATVTISGTPTSTGPYNYAVQVKDSTAPNAQSTTQTYSGMIQAAPMLTAFPASLGFSYRQGDVAPTPQTVSVFSSGGMVNFTVSTSGGAWIAPTPASGQTAAVVSVTANITGLQPGTYDGVLTVNASGTSPTSIAIPIHLAVTTPPPPTLSLSFSQMIFGAVQGGPPGQQRLAVSNSGTGALAFTVATAGGSWLGVGANTGHVVSGTPTAVTVIADPTGLQPATYFGLLTITSSDGSQVLPVPVTMTVSALPLSIQLWQPGMEFTAVAEGTPPPPQAFGVGNSGLGTMNWALNPQTLGGSSGWLNLGVQSGTSTAGSLPVPIPITVDPHGLSPGQYYGSIRVGVPGSGGPSQTIPKAVTVLLNVLDPAQMSVAPVLSTSGVLLVGSDSGITSTDITLSNITSHPISFSTTQSTADGGGWLLLNPATGTIPAASSLKLTIEAATSLLPSAVGRGVVRLGYSNGSSGGVDVTAVYPSAASVSAHRNAFTATAPTGCQQAVLVPQFTSLSQGFTVAAGHVVRLSVQVVDNCGSSIPTTTGSSVIVSFGNKDPSVNLRAADAQNWTGLWVPSVAASNVSVQVDAFLIRGTQLIGGVSTISGSVVAAPADTSASPSVVLNSASYKGAGQVSPGSWVSIFGARMADSQESIPSAPFPTDLVGTTVQLGDSNLPMLYVGASQVNALIPSGLSPNAPYTLRVQRGNTLSNPVTVTVADVQPAIYSINEQGTGQGAIVIATDGAIAAPAGTLPGSRPVNRGEYIEIYCAGLGAVVNGPPDGFPAPLMPPLTTTVAAPSVTIGGVTADVITFSGLTPGQVGLYQINVQVPATAPAGDAVPVTLSIGNGTSNTVTLAVQ